MTIAEELEMPNGITFHDGALYVAEAKRLIRFPDIEQRLESPGEPEVVLAEMPYKNMLHAWKYVDVGPDGKLYVAMGAPCNVCEASDLTTIMRMDPAGTNTEVFASGVRNSVGFDWHPVTGELWFTDNGRDWAGNDGPQDELNRIPKNQEGAHFGFPYCHADGIPDRDIVRPNPCAGVIMPAALTGPHSAGLGIRFYTGGMFPPDYRHVAFIARHGSWNREQKFGYDVAIARTRPDGTATIQPFLTGLLDENANAFFGRPAYVFQRPDGSLLVSDDYNGAIYRISYTGTR